MAMRFATIGKLTLLLAVLGCEATTAAPGKTTVTVEPPEMAQGPQAGAVLAGPASSAAAGATALGPIASDLSTRLAKFQPFPVAVDPDRLDQKTRLLLRPLIAAAQRIDDIYLLQIYDGNPRLRAQLVADGHLANALSYFDFMKGPWDRTDPLERPFIGTRSRPPGGGFYPEDLTKEELLRWIEGHPQDKEAFQSYFTVIGRDAKGGLSAIPFAQAYKDLLGQAARKLNEAAQLTDDARVKSFLTKRAAAFLSNDYLESDIAWMDLGSAPLEITIGPYEMYDDGLMGWKASFEALIGLRDDKESERLAKITQHLPQLERNLPLDAKFSKQTERGSASPISVIQLLYSSGQGGIHATAYNLPNDERVRKAKGSKKVLMKNVGEAKYRASTWPIAQRVIAAAQLPLVTYDAAFTFVLMHEMAHGLGPATVAVRDGSEQVSKALQELYNPIEEAKADICGLISAQWLIDHGVFPRSLERQLYTTYVAGAFRAVRFGATEAHARGELASYNYIAEHGGVRYDEKVKRFAVDFAKIKGTVRALAHEWLAIEAKGDRAAARAFFDRYGTMKPEMQAMTETLGDIPVDIRPQFTVTY